MTGAPNTRSAAPANAFDSGAVAEMTNSTAGHANPRSTHTRKWMGVVTSARGGGTAFSAARMSSA